MNCLIVNDNAYQIDLSFFSSSPFRFIIDTFSPLTNEVITADCAEFDADNNLLTMPCIDINDTLVQADLGLTSLDPILVGIQGAAIIGPKSNQLI